MVDLQGGLAQVRPRHAAPAAGPVVLDSRTATLDGLSRGAQVGPRHGGAPRSAAQPVQGGDGAAHVELDHEAQALQGHLGDGALLLVVRVAVRVAVPV